MKVLRFQEYNTSEDLAMDFIEMLSNPTMLESVKEDTEWKQILNKIFSDLGLNYTLIATFGAGISAMFPIVDKLIKNGTLNIEINNQNILLLTVAAIMITYLEEKKVNLTSKKIDMSDDEIKQNAQSLLEELKLRGIGNGIVKKAMKCFTSIKDIIKKIFKHTINISNSFIDMFAYTSFMVPTMNIFNSFIDKYDLNLETLPNNFLSLGIGVISIVAKNGIDYLINKLGDKFKLKKDLITKDLETSIVKKYPHPDFIDTPGENLDLIKGNEN